VGEPTFDVDEILERLEALRGEATYRLIDILEEAAVERLDQIRRFGLGLRRRISIAVARKIEHAALLGLVRQLTENPGLELRRGLHVRMLEVPVTPEGSARPAASVYFVLIRSDVRVTVAAGTVQADGGLAQTRSILRRPADIGFWTRDALDQFLRQYLRQLFEELEAHPGAPPCNRVSPPSP